MRQLLLKLVLPAAATLLLAACGGGEETQQLPVAPAVPTGVLPYAGPDPLSDDVQAWRINVWENLRIDERCSRCHVPGIQAPFFMREDDINDAFGAFYSYVDTDTPSQSEVVTKVAAGHQCWETESLVCGDLVLRWIEDWLTIGGATGSRQIDILPIAAEDLKERTRSKQFPNDSSLFSGSQLYTDVKTWCSECHSSNAADPRKPFFADAVADTAYAEIISKISLADIPTSRIVERPRGEGHGCPQQECANYADQLEQDIIAYAALLPEPETEDGLIDSRALVIGDDGIVAAGGNRHETNLVALYEFKIGRGFTAFDTSGESPAMNLTITDEEMWMSNWGLEFDGDNQKAQATVEDSTKLYNRIGLTGEYTIEAWVVPGNVTQEEAFIVGYSGGTDRRNFTLGQTLYNYDFFNRSSETDSNGEAALSTADADEDLQASLQYVVITYSPVDGRRIYVNGAFTGDDDPVPSGSIGNWSDSFAFVLGNEVSGQRPWQGQARMVAVHDRAFTQEQIDQNYAVQPGQKYFMIFNIDEWSGLTDSYIMFEASQYDQYSYLFTEPKLVLLGDSQDPGGLVIKGMRIGINGQVERPGQVYGNMNEFVNTYQDGGYPLSPLGTVLPLRYGLELDQFFLSFEQLGSATNVFTDLGQITPTPPPADTSAPDVGVRLFDEINATMAEVTNIHSTGTADTDEFPEVRKTYLAVRQQLPPTSSLDGFSGAHQAGIAQIAIEYCNALVEETSERSNFWDDFVFPATLAESSDVNAFLGTDAQRNYLINPLIEKMLGINLSSQPLVGDVTDIAPKNLADNDNDPKTIKVGMTIKGELNSLITDLSACNNACPPRRVETIAKATCSAVLGNAGMAMQ